MTVFYIILGASAGLLLLSHIAAVFLDGALGRVSGYLGALFSAALFFSTSYIWRSLETSLVAVLGSLLVYLILSLVRIYIVRKRRRAEEGEI